MFIIQWVSACVAGQKTIQIHTPIGVMNAKVCADILCGLTWSDKKQSHLPYQQNMLQQQMDQYWQDAMQKIEIKLLKQGSAYRQKIWSELIKIPLGQTLNYKALAEKTGSASRPVAGACRDNPYPIIIPCHRVVSVSGLGGYAGQTTGYMMEIKQQLIAYEATKR